MNAAHKGYTPHYLDYFVNSEKYKVHFRNWLCEDGGRLYNKRNLNMTSHLPRSKILYEISIIVRT